MSKEVSDRVIALRVPGVITDLLPVLVGFCGFAVIVFTVSQLFASLDWRPFGDTVADHAREAAIVAGIIFSSLIGLGRMFMRSLDVRIMKPAKQVEEMFKPYLDSMTDSLARLTESNTALAAEVGQIAQKQQHDGERIAWLEGQAGQPLGSAGRSHA